MPIVAAVFDAFGTVVHIRRKHHPFRKLLRIGAHQGRKPSASDLHCLMTSSLALEEAAEVFAIRLSSQQLTALQDDLHDELESISVYTDAVEALQLLKAEGMVTGVCSNLAAPYGPVLRHLLSDMDGFALSFEVGEMKPHERIYREICHQLGRRLGADLTAPYGQVVMVGDSLQCDQNGPRAVGISGHYLDRTGAGSLSDLVQFAERVIKDKRLGESTG